MTSRTDYFKVIGIKAFPVKEHAQGPVHYFYRTIIIEHESAFGRRASDEVILFGNTPDSLAIGGSEKPLFTAITDSKPILSELFCDDDQY